MPWLALAAFSQEGSFNFINILYRGNLKQELGICVQFCILNVNTSIAMVYVIYVL